MMRLQAKSHESEKETPNRKAHVDHQFIGRILRRFATGKTLPAAQLEELEKGGFICSVPGGGHQLTFAGAQYLQKGPTP